MESLGPFVWMKEIEIRFDSIQFIALKSIPSNICVEFDMEFDK